MIRKAISRSDGAGESQQRRRRSPTHVDRVDNRVDEQRQARGDGHGAGQVKRAGSALGAALDQRPRRERRGGESDRDVDEQHPPPAQAAGEDPAEEHPGRAAGAGDRAPDAQCAVALGTLGERGGDDRQRRRGDDRRAEALDGAGGDQPPLGLGDPAGERGDREHHEAEHEHPPAPEQVGEPAAEQQEAAERKRVGIHDPREVGACEVQVRADRRQRDVDDRGVDHDHELRHRQQQQSEVLGAGGVQRRRLGRAQRCHGS